MSVDEARRLLLHDAARTALGADAALVLMEMLPPTGWADVATRQDLVHLESSMDHRFEQLEARMDHRFGQVDHRFEALRLEFRADMANGQRRMIQWNIATMIAAAGVVIAAVRLG
ncbi:MAG: hypothetical protein ACXVJW_14385 [Acidimicrobiia bacterium]